MDGMNAPNLLSMQEAIHEMRGGTLSANELRGACSQQIERLNPRLNAFITVTGAELGADETKPTIGQSRDTSLAGIPIAVKDLYETAHVRTTAGSLFFKDYVPEANARVVERLGAAGALIMGKTNTHEIALGVTTVNPHFGACRNPWDEARIPGGSSGGSAVAVATGMALAGLGTDTGGSIRIPAALCGIVGLKPTFGRVSLRGIIPLSWNLDHAGPLTNTVEDAALLLQVIAGYDADDPSCVDEPMDDYLEHLKDGIEAWRVGVGIGEYVGNATAEILAALNQAAQVLRTLGAVVETVDISFLREAAAANSIMTQADAAAYHRQRLAEHPDWFGEDVRRRLETGRNVTSTEYSLARRTQTEARRSLSGLLEEYQILLLPTTPITAPLIEGSDAVEQARRLTRFTAPFNLTGLPAISIPCGASQEGLPMGLQMVAGPWREAKLLRAAFAYEAESTWGRRRPPLARS